MRTQAYQPYELARTFQTPVVLTRLSMANGHGQVDGGMQGGHAGLPRSAGQRTRAATTPSSPARPEIDPCGSSVQCAPHLDETQAGQGGALVRVHAGQRTSSSPVESGRARPETVPAALPPPDTVTPVLLPPGDAARDGARDGAREAGRDSPADAGLAADPGSSSDPNPAGEAGTDAGAPLEARSPALLPAPSSKAVGAATISATHACSGCLLFCLNTQNEVTRTA